MDANEQRNNSNFENEEFKKQFGASFKEFQNLFKDFEDYFTNNYKKIIKGKDIIKNISISFEESINGKEEEIIFEKNIICKTCNGNKCQPNHYPIKCTNCNGTGTIEKNNNESPCDICNMKGEIIDHPCKKCIEGLVYVLKKENIKIFPGINSGNNLRYLNKGNVGKNGGESGDLIVKINVDEDDYFNRENYNIYTNAYIIFSQSILGDNILIKGLNGNEKIKIPKFCENGHQITLKNKGIINLPPNDNKYGNHIVTIKIVTNSIISIEQIKLIQQLNKLDMKNIELLKKQNLNLPSNILDKFKI